MLSPAGRRALLVAAVLTCGSPALARQTSVAPQSVPADAARSKPKVRLIATGGTISNRSGGRLTADELVKSISTLDRYVRAESEQFANVSSSSLTLTQWIDLAKRINLVFREDADLSGVVVTSGTDTLEETAYFLNLTVKSDKPVVVVGSMRNPSTLGYEGAANLLAGFRVAAEPASRGKGVLVVLNDEINAARDVTKTDSLRLDTFRGSYGALGTVDSDRVVYYRTEIRRHTAASEFDVATITELPRVDVVLVYQGASGDVIKAIVDLGARGIVMAAAGAGAMSGTQGAGIDYAVSKGIIVVTTTRAGSGRVPARLPPSAGGSASTPRLRISGEDLSPVKARILLMLALGATKDAAEIQRMFLEY
jgi:L-asparaginase